MKRILICICTLGLALSTFATGQDGDVIIINGERWSLLAKPISADSTLFHRLKAVLPPNRPIVTSNWDGYTAYWSIKNEHLCLDSITVSSYNNDTRQYKEECLPAADMQHVFDNYRQEGDIVASWVNRDIRAAKGKKVYYVHLYFERNHEYEQILTVKEGRVTGRQAYHNRVVVDGFSLKSLEAQQRKTDWQAIREIFPLHTENYPELDGDTVIFFTVKDIQLDSLGNLVDCRVRAIIGRGTRRDSEGLAQEMKELLKDIRPWKTLFINGEYLPEERNGCTFPYHCCVKKKGDSFGSVMEKRKICTIEIIIDKKHET